MAPKRQHPISDVTSEAKPEDADAESPAKKARVAEEEGEEAAAMEVDAEVEQDAKPDTRKKLGTPIAFDARDATLNVVPTTGGRVLMALSDGGMQYLIAGARANVGVKSGRYLFEVRIVELLNPKCASAKPPMPKQLVRLGFSLPGSSLFLGDTEDSFCFDSEGHFTAQKKRINKGGRFTRDQVIGVLLNLEAGSPCANTISLFQDGKRSCEPIPIPEAMHGKVLCPTVVFRNVSVQVHWGPEPMCPLGFKCTSLQGAAADDVVVTTPPPKLSSAGHTHEVVFPISLPEEGTFDWLDTWRAAHPDYVEISDRSLIEWATKSGIVKRPGKGASWKNCNDRPDVSFGIQALDDFTPRGMIRQIAAVVPRNYIVMEVKSNLVKSDREELLRLFNLPQYKRVALVAVGQPPASYLAPVHKEILQEKQDKLNVEFEKLKAEKEKKRKIEIRQKEILKQREIKKAAEEARKAALEAKKKAILEAKEKAAKEAEEKAKKEAEEAKKKEAADGEGKEGDAAMKDSEAKEGDEAKSGDKEAKEESKEEAKEEAKEEVKEESKEGAKDEPMEEAKQEKVEEQAEPPEEELVAPIAELDDEDKKLWHRPHTVLDLQKQVMEAFFPKFSLPDKDEGFQEVRYEWQKEKESNEYVRKWVADRKFTARVEDIQPSEWFYGKLTEWQKSVQEWQKKQKVYKAKEGAKAKEKEDAKKKEAAAKKAKLAEDAKKKEAAEKEEAKDAEKKDGEEDKKEEKAEGGDGETGKEDEKKEAEAKEGAEKKEEQKADEKKEDKKEEDSKMREGEDEKKEEEDEEAKRPPPVDIWSADDVNDIGEGEPLYVKFTFEDWALMCLRFEFHTLARSFKRDTDDPDRPGMHEMHVPFYYNKYYKKQLNTKFYGVSTINETCEMVKDTVVVTDSLVYSQLSEDLEATPEHFVKLTEEARRERQRRIDAGDEGAKLKFSVVTAAAAQQAQQAGERLTPGAQGRANWQQKSVGQQNQPVRPGATWGSNQGGGFPAKGKGKGGNWNRNWGSW